jgi:hypothetical protein
MAFTQPSSAYRNPVLVCRVLLRGMSSPREIRAKLERDYAILLSKYERAEIAVETIVGLQALEAADRRIAAQRKVWREKMDKLSYLLRLQVDPEWTDGHIRPLHERKSRAKGDISKAAYRILKAAREPLKTFEIARLVAPSVGVDQADFRAIAKINSSVSGALTRRADEGMVDRFEGPPIRWAVRPRKWSGSTSPVAFASVPLVRVCASTEGPTSSASASSRQIRRQAGG